MRKTLPHRIGVLVLAVLIGAVVGLTPVSTAGAGRPTPAALEFQATSATFENIPVGETRTASIDLWNTGQKAANRLQLWVEGTGFSILSDTCPEGRFLAGAMCTVQLQFAPTSAGSVTGALFARAGRISATPVPLSGTSVPPRFIYWGYPDIGRANLDGSSASPAFIATGYLQPRSMDVAGGYVYWAEITGNAILRASLTGPGAPETIHTLAEPSEIHGIVATESFLYWTQYSSSSIWRADLDGSNPTELLTGATNASGIDVDDTHIYWSQQAQPSSLHSVPLSDLSASPTLLHEYSFTSNRTPGDVEVDGGRLYWSETDWDTYAGSVYSVPVVPVEGGDVQVHASLGAPNRAESIALDGGWLYVAVYVDDSDDDYYDSYIARAPLAGSGDLETLVTGIEGSFAVAVA